MPLQWDQVLSPRPHECAYSMLKVKKHQIQVTHLDSAAYIINLAAQIQQIIA